jgi:hypothetical protein
MTYIIKMDNKQVIKRSKVYLKQEVIDYHSYVFITRKYIPFISIIGLLLVSFSSCNKSEKKSFSIGNVEDPELTITFPDTVISNFTINLPATYKMDVDMDGTDDFQFISSNVSVDETTSYSMIEIACLNNQSFLGVRTISDTTFVESWSGTIENWQGKKETTLYKYYSHYRSKPEDSIIEITELQYAVPFKRYDPLEQLNWLSARCLLVRTGYSLYFVNYQSGSDWVSYMDLSYAWLNLFPDTQIRYIGIRKMENGKEKLGWIKAFLSNSTITILEIALQK